MKAHYSNRAFLVGACLVVLITIVAYYPGMSAGFYFDDEPNILWAKAVQWTQFDFDTFQRTLSEVLIPTRPVANLSVGLNHLLSGLDPAPYHWTNLVIHLFVGLALYWVLRLFQRHHGENERGAWLALALVLVFLVHPLNSQAVTYIIQRMTSLAALFFLLGLACYVTGRHQELMKNRLTWFAMSLLFALMSAGSKETGYLLIPCVLLYEYCFYGNEWRKSYRSKLPPRSRAITNLGIAVAVLVMGLLAWQLIGHRFHWTDVMPGRDFSGLERLMTQGRTQFFYLSLLLWPAPSRLSLDHEFIVSRGLFEPVSTLFALGAWVIIVIVALWNARTRPLVAFPLLAYLLLHSAESAPINLELVFEHRMYLPMTMLTLLAALTLGKLTQRYEPRSYLAIGIVGLLLSIGTYERNEVWGDPLAFYRDCAAKSPNKWRPQYNLGTHLGKLGLVDEARVTLERAVEIRHDDSETHNQLANVLAMQQQLDLAEEHYRLAVQYDAENAEALFNLASILGSQQRYAEQKEILEQFILHAPPYLERQKQWAIAYLDRMK
jgi:hypothetical protein